MRNRGALLGSVVLIMLTSMLVGAGTTAYFSDVETASGLGFRTATLDLELGTSASASWITPKDWAPGDTTDFTATLHIKSLGGTGIPAKSLIVHIFVDETGELKVTEPERKAGGQHINDLDSKIAIVGAEFDIISDGEPAIDIFEALCSEFDENEDGEIKLPEIVCHEWDLLEKSGVDEMVPCTDYELYLEFKFQEDAGNAYQADFCKISIEFLANQIRWEPDTWWFDTFCISTDGVIEEDEPYCPPPEFCIPCEDLWDEMGFNMYFALDNKFLYLAFCVPDPEGQAFLYLFMDTEPGEGAGTDDGVEYGYWGADYMIGYMPGYMPPMENEAGYLSKWFLADGIEPDGWSTPDEYVCEAFIGVKNLVYDEGEEMYYSIYEFKIPLECIEVVYGDEVGFLLHIGGPGGEGWEEVYEGWHPEPEYPDNFMWIPLDVSEW